MPGYLYTRSDGTVVPIRAGDAMHAAIIAEEEEKTLLRNAISQFLAAGNPTEVESARTAAREVLGPDYLNCGCPAAVGVCRREVGCIYLRRCRRHCYACHREDVRDG